MSDTLACENVTIDPNIAAGVWLLSATKDICDDAKLRIEHEVCEHFVTKYNEELVRLGYAVEAIEATLAAMGDPKKANRKYRAMYLTAKQANYMERITHLHLARNVVFPWLSVIPLIVLVLRQIVSKQDDDAIFAVWLLFASMWPVQNTLHYLFSRRPRVLQNASIALCAAYTITALILTNLAIPYFSTGEIAFGLSLLPFILAGSVVDIFLIRKARRSARNIRMDV